METLASIPKCFSFQENLPCLDKENSVNSFVGKEQKKEPDIIGGQGPLTKEEESAISKYLADKKTKGKRKVMLNPSTRKKEKVD
jgi:hypothetical protein